MSIKLIKDMRNFHLLVFSLFFSVGEAAMRITCALLTGYIIDIAILREPDLLVEQLIRAGIVTIVLFVCVVAKDSAFGRYFEMGMEQLYNKTMKIVCRSRYEILQKQNSGEIVSRITGDLGLFGASLRPVLILGISIIVVQVVIIAYLLTVNIGMTLVTFFMLPILFWIQRFVGGAVKRNQKQYLEAMGQTSSVAAEALHMFETIKVMNLEKDFKERFQKSLSRQKRIEKKNAGIAALLLPLGKCNIYVPQILLIILGSNMIRQREITAGELVSFITLANVALSFLANISELIISIKKLGACAERVEELWQWQDEGCDYAEGINDLRNKREGTVLAFRDVDFRYGTRPVLDKITFEVKNQEKVAIIGESGCGKSTILQLAATIIDENSGAVEFFGKNKKHCSLEELRQCIAYVPQESFIWPISVYENIIMGMENISKEKIYYYLKMVGMDRFVKSLPDGLDTILEDNGRNLSGGQRQRLAMVRALIREPRLLLLDEATSALDEVTEKSVIEQCMKLPYRPAILFVTHRIAATKMFQKVIRVEGGGVEYV